MALAIGLCGSAGCGAASADVLAVWIDGQFDENGNREVQIYDRGEHRSITLAPVIPGSGTELLQLAVDNQARGLIASGTRETVYVDLRQGRRGRLSNELDTTRELSPDFGRFRNGDALVRELVTVTTSAARRLAFLALNSRHGLVPTVLDSPGEPDATAQWALLSAAAAPVAFWVEERGTPIAAAGRVQAVVYPGVDDSGTLPDVMVPTVVATGLLQGRGVEDNNSPGRISDGICPHRVCVSPSGHVLTTMAEAPCVLWRWDWTEAVTPDTPLAAWQVPLPEGCPAENDPSLVATLGDDLVVMDDDDRIFLFDLARGTTMSVPKVREGLARIALAGRGTVLLWLTFSGQLVRVDASGPRLVTTERSYCSIADATAVSPSGNWVAMSCNGQPPFEGAPEGLVLRLSALGLEQYTGISMRPVAIDDEGNALLHSFDSGDSDAAPRGLFVLSGDGVLARVDDLEPGPAQIAVPSEAQGRIEGRYFHAVGIPPGTPSDLSWLDPSVPQP